MSDSVNTGPLVRVEAGRFSSIKRFSFYAAETPNLLREYPQRLDELLEFADARGATLNGLHRVRLEGAWFATFSIRQSFSTGATGDTPWEACVAALIVAEAHAKWLDENPIKRGPLLPRPVMARSGKAQPKISLADLFED